MRTLHWYLWDALVKMRREARLDQDELAELTDVARTSISNYEAGRTRPKWTTVIRIAQACDYRVDDELRDLWGEWRSRDTVSQDKPVGEQLTLIAA